MRGIPIPAPRGLCAVCGKEFPLTTKFLIRQHQLPGRFKGNYCNGGGELSSEGQYRRRYGR